MADKKISQLTGATTPLAGTEVLPIVQGGSTVKVSVANLTAGRAVSADSASLTQRLQIGSSDTTYAIEVGNTAAGSSGNCFRFIRSTTEFGAYISAGVPFFGTLTSNDFNLITNSTSRARIFASGGISVGDTTDPGAGNLRVGNGNLVVGTAGKGIVDSGNVDRVNIASAATVVNESGADLDFRVEGDTNANLLFVDAGNDRVGIQTSSPNTPLEVVGSGGLRVDEAGTGANVVVIRSDFAGAGPAVNVASNSPLLFQTNNTERARITATGNVVAGASVALATTATDGFLYVPTCAGTPTGTPTAITGMAPIVVDTTNNKLYFYSGGQWRDAGP